MQLEQANPTASSQNRPTRGVSQFDFEVWSIERTNPTEDGRSPRLFPRPQTSHMLDKTGQADKNRRVETFERSAKFVGRELIVIRSCQIELLERSMRYRFNIIDLLEGVSMYSSCGIKLIAAALPHSTLSNRRMSIHKSSFDSPATSGSSE